VGANGDLNRVKNMCERDNVVASPLKGRPMQAQPNYPLTNPSSGFICETKFT